MNDRETHPSHSRRTLGVRVALECAQRMRGFFRDTTYGAPLPGRNMPSGTPRTYAIPGPQAEDFIEYIPPHPNHDFKVALFGTHDGTVTVRPGTPTLTYRGAGAVMDSRKLSQCEYEAHVARRVNH